MSPARHASMEEVRKEMRDEYAHFLRLSRFVPNDSAYFSLLENRFSVDGKPVLRAYYVRLLLDYVQDELTESATLLPPKVAERVLPMVIEILMVVMYYDNQILDQKGGITTSKGVNSNLLQSNILLSELYHYIEISVEDLHLRLALTTLVREVYEVVNIGQQIEQQCNHYHNWRNNDVSVTAYQALPYNEHVIQTVLAIVQGHATIPEERQLFLEMYLRRIYLTNAYLFVRFADFIGDYAVGISTAQKEALHQFAGFGGMALQMVNDIIDFVPAGYSKGTQAKLAEDAMRDLKNQNVTLPLILHLSQGTRSILTDMLDDNYQQNYTCWYDELLLARAIITDGSIGKSKKIAFAVADYAVAYLNMDDDMEDFLSSTKSNWFYIRLSELVKKRSIQYQPIYII